MSRRIPSAWGRMSRAAGGQPMRKILRDPEQQALLEERGYVFHDFLGPEEIAVLRRLYFETAGSKRETYDFATGLTYYISIFDKNRAHRRAANEGIRRLFIDALEELMCDYRAVLCNFMVKEPGGGEIASHQDTTLVDEAKYVACNLWVPLQDTDTSNGCFHMIPGTHRLFESTYRSNSIPDSLVAYNEHLRPLMRPQPLPAGRGILFDHKMFHYSPDNLSTVPRLAVQLLLIPCEADVAIACYDRSSDPDSVNLLRVPDDDYLTDADLFEGNMTRAPEGLELLDKRPYQRLPEPLELVNMIQRQIERQGE